MTATNVTYQSPQPKIEVLDSNGDGKHAKVSFMPHKIGTTSSYGIFCDALQSYQFSLTNGDSQGSFSMTLFPDVVTQNGRVALFDKIALRDVIKIYESKAEALDQVPIFTGIVTRKKYVMQAGDGGASRRLSISGTAITALVAQYKLELDTRAVILKIANKLQSGSKSDSEQSKNAEAAADEKSEGDASVVATINAFNVAADTPAKEVLERAWTCYDSISQQFGTTKIKAQIETFIGKDFFECNSDTVFHYPMTGAQIINSNGSQNFDSLIDKLFPAPLYEKTAYTNIDGGMKIRIRQVPFDNAAWGIVNTYVILPKYVKSIDVEQSNKEVYTVFFSYLEGSPTSEDFNYILAATGAEGSSTPAYLTDKFAIYGYRPFNCTFYGYINGTDDRTNDDTALLKDTNEKLAAWYGRLDEMLQGSLTLAMTYDDKSRIMPGDKVALLGCEFYVEGIAHSWSYGGGGDINISLSRGGAYNAGAFDGVPDDFTDALRMFKNGNIGEADVDPSTGAAHTYR